MELNKVYSFETTSPVFLGHRYSEVKLVSTVNASIAAKFSPIAQQYAQVFPTLPSGTPSDINDGVWYIFEKNGKNIVLSEYYIDTATIIEVITVSLRVNIPRGSMGDISVIRAALTAAGISDFEITTV